MKGHRVLLYLKSRWRGIAAFAVFVAASGVCAALYSLPFEAVLYPALLVAAFAVVMAVLDILRTARRHSALSALRALPDDLSDYLPEPDTIAEEDLSDIIRRLEDRISRLTDDFSRREADTINYYTMWAHQIKTPIASMHLILQKQDSEDSRRLRTELMRIEQYVEMVLCFLRLDSDSTDYVLKAYRLDDIIRPAIRKLAPQFIMKRLELDYETIDKQVLTDEKWLGFVIEQVLSNAVKYTERGKVKISCEGSKLIISDTGIGIAPDDLPRIFDKGYTGFNGRMDRKASGIGLYLCRRICNNLGHGITAESVPGQGTTITIELERNNLEVE